MRTSLNEIREAERFLANEMAREDSLVFQARMMLNPLQRLNFMLQKKLMVVIQLYHRRNLKRDLRAVHQRLLTSPENEEFQQALNHIFDR